MKRHAQWLVGLALLFLASGAHAGCFGGKPNGTKNPGEACDDGNQVDTDNCTNTCEVPFCGDTIVRTTHNCGADPALPCQTNADCTRYTTCILDPADDHCASLPNHPCTSNADCANLGTCTEACDDGNTNNCDTCQINCTRVTGCGDGATCPPEECDPPASRGGNPNCSDACRVAVCGNGRLDSPQEECDGGTALCMGGTADRAQCGSCQQNQACEAGGGHCGPGNTEWRPGDCRLNCKLAFCGDGVVDPVRTTRSSLATLTVASRNDEERTTTTTVRGATSTTTSTTLPPPRGEVCDDGLVDPAHGPSLADDMDDCPNGPLAIAAGVACKIVNQCGDAFPHSNDTSKRCGGKFEQCGGGPGPCTTPATLEQCDNGNGALRTCQGKLGQLCQTNGECGTRGPCVAVKTCRNQPDVFCATDHDCDLFPCTNSGCTMVPDICGNSDTTPNACRSTVQVPATDGLIQERHCVNPVCGDDVVDEGEGCDEGIGACVRDSARNDHECSTAPGHQMCLQAGGSCVDAAGADRGASCDTFPSNCLSDTVRDACRGSQCPATQAGGLTGGCCAPTCGDGVLDCDTTPGPSIPSPCEQCDLRRSNDGAAGNCPDCKFAFCGDTRVKDPHSCGSDPNLPCNSNGDCAGHNLDRCMKGFCGDPRTRCTSNSECGPPFLCVAGLCGGPARRCTSDGECQDPNLALCLATPNCGSDPHLPCGQDGDCTPFTKCTNGTCGSSGNGCRADADCARLAVCVEQCDDGNLNDRDFCKSMCKQNVCGDGIVNQTLACHRDGTLDPGTRRPRLACQNDGQCILERCVNGKCSDDVGCCVTDADCRKCLPIEECDDGNLTDNDGCDSNCLPTGCQNCITNMSCGGNGTVPPGAKTGICTSDPDCAALGVCKSGLCGGPRRPCASNADCQLNPSPALSPVCLNGFCGGVPVPCPNGNSDCAPLATCVIEQCDDGNDVMCDNVKCTTNTDCQGIGSGQCLNGLCACTTDSDCKSSPFACLNGLCAGCTPTKTSSSSAPSCVRQENRCGDGVTCPRPTQDEMCDDVNATSLDGCFECCLEATAGADAIRALKCFRAALKTALEPTNIPDRVKNRLGKRLDLAGRREGNGCQGVHLATLITAMVCRQLDLANFRNWITVAEHQELAAKCGEIEAWYSQLARNQNCP